MPRETDFFRAYRRRKNYAHLNENTRRIYLKARMNRISNLNQVLSLRDLYDRKILRPESFIRTPRNR